MAEPTPASSTFRFGVFEVDLQSGELRRKGRKLKLQEQPFQVLAMLLERPGEVVTREALREKLWPADTFVEFDHSLNTAISKLREALGDSADNPRFVETLPRRGYRFIAPVEAQEQAVPLPRARLRPIWLATLALVALVVLLVGLNVGGLRERLLGRAGPGRIESLAVLPLANLSGDPEQDYFADGMTEALTTELGKISALRVISRQSVMRYKGTDKPVPEIARELNVDAVVEGSVLRSGDRVRISAQLIEAVPERHLWAESFERGLSDILALQSEVARAIANEIKVKLTPQEQARLRSTRPVDPAAYEFYLKGRHFLHRGTGEEVEKAIAYFQQATEIDPSYARAYVGLADSYDIDRIHGIAPKEDYQRAKAAVLKALELDATLAEAHASLANLKAIYEWEWLEAEKGFKRAIELNPSYAPAHHWCALRLAECGRFDEAITEIRRAQQLDPLSPQISAAVGRVFFLARQYDQAIQEFRKTLELQPNQVTAHGGLGCCYGRKEMYEDAVAEGQKAVSLSARSPAWLAHLGYTYGLAGSRNAALKILDELKELYHRGDAGPMWLATVYTGLGEKDQAFAWLESAYEERDPQMGCLKVDPAFDRLRSDPHFQDLLRRMNFPE